MAERHFAGVLRQIRRLIDAPAGDGLMDGQLVERFAAAQDQAAFELLLHRHGPMVLNVCRFWLRDQHDVDDAFQATFLVLARKASSIRKRSSVASWLFGVAQRIARQARANAARRRRKEREVAELDHVEPAADLGQHEMHSLLREELQRLPEKYRAPLVLCYLQGKTNDSAARELGVPSGSMAKRLTRARDLLRERLVYRGAALSVAGCAALLNETAATAAVPAALLNSTLQAATLFAASSAVAGVIPEPAAALAEGALHTMHATQRKIVAALAIVLLLAGGGIGMLAIQSDAAAPAKAAVQLPEDPRAIVLRLDVGDAAPDKEPHLAIRADGTAIFGNPRGDSRRAEAKLSAAELQDLLRQIIREQAVFDCDTRRLEDALRKSTGAADGPAFALRITADGREHEVRCRGLNESLALQLVDVKEVGRLWAVRQRLERVVTWLQAGGPAGVEAALKAANDRLRQEFPDAPPLTGADLHAARLYPDGRGEVTLQQRGVAPDRNPFSFVYARVERPAQGAATVVVKANLAASGGAAAKQEPAKRYLEPIKMDPSPIAKDAAVVYDYDVVYVRAPRHGDKTASKWAEVGDPRSMEPGSDLMLLHPDGSEEVLVAVQPQEAIVDPFVSFDGQSVYYAKMHDAKKHKGADIYRIHLATRKIVQLTNQTFTPNTGAADWAKTPLPSWGVHNFGPCPLPGGRIAFVSDRNAFKGTNTGYAPHALALQLFVMDEDGGNVECIGHLNLGMALHPVILKDGRLMFSSLESQGLRSHHLWGVWSIHPDGSNWGPLFSAYEIGNGTADSTHFQAQLSDESIVVQSYYNLNNFGFGTYYKFPVRTPEGVAGFGPGYKNSPANGALRHGRQGDGRPNFIRFPFSPFGIEALTPFVLKGDWPSEPSVAGKNDSPRVGKFTHPASAPDNHLLTAWSPGSLNSYTKHSPAFDSGIYLIKSGKPIDEPGQMVLVKNDPNYHEQWPRAVVPYKRIYGVEEPRRLGAVANDGKQSPRLPEGSPFGLVGTSSLYKRESYPYGVVRPGSVTASYAGDKDPTGHRGFDNAHNWTVQGADAGLYENSEIHGIRIIALEPNTERQGGPKSGRLFYNHAKERIRILGEFPVRKFNGDRQPIDPDGNPDTSFLVKLPADMAWTFQTLDKHGMVLNSAQTWHQVRPGEIRNDCGGCHAHSQQPTHFKDTAAAKSDYVPFDLTRQTPLLTTKKLDESKKKWDANDETGVRFANGPKTVEYHRDIKPIFERSCIACHTQKAEKPAGNLVLDDDTIIAAENPAGLGFGIRVPASYARLAADGTGKFGHKPLNRHGWTEQGASRYIKQMQSRRSLLVWKVFGQRLDGWSNEDFPHETVPGDPTSVHFKGQPFADTPQNRDRAQVAYLGSQMPPPAAVAGTYVAANGEKIKVAPLTDEDRLTLVRWIDLGCPIDLDYNPAKPAERGYGWMLDDNRPTLALTYPQAGANSALMRLLVGMHDYDTGLDLESLSVVADFPIDGVAAGENLAKKFQALPDNRWELSLARPITDLPKGKLTVSVKDKQGNTTRIERTFSIAAQGNE